MSNSSQGTSRKSNTSLQLAKIRNITLDESTQDLSEMAKKTGSFIAKDPDRFCPSTYKLLSQISNSYISTMNQSAVSLEKI